MAGSQRLLYDTIIILGIVSRGAKNNHVSFGGMFSNIVLKGRGYKIKGWAVLRGFPALQVIHDS